MNYRLLSLSFRGRIGRLWYWIGTAATWAASYPVSFVAEGLLRTDVTSVTYVRGGVEMTEALAFPVISDPVNIAIWIVQVPIALAIVYAALGVKAKRWHDRDKSGWWTLILFLPIIGWVWTIVDCGVLRGTEGTNRFGTDPLVDPVAALDRSFGQEV